MAKVKLLVLDENEEFLVSLGEYAQNVLELEVLGSCVADSESLSHFESVPDVIFCASSIINSLEDGQLEQIRSKWPHALLYRLTVFDESGYDEFATPGFDGSVPRSGIEKHLTRLVDEVRSARKSKEVNDDD